MRRAWIAAASSAMTTAVLLAPGAARAADEEEWERDLVLEVQGTPGENDEQHLVRVLDEATGRPVPWAAVRHFTEMTGVRAHLLRVLRADAHGLVEIDASVWPADGHWVVEAPGYAPTQAYGVVPASPVELVRPHDVALRLLDGMGRPVAGAEVRAHEGCGHAPDLAKPRTDEHGRFVLRGIAPRTAMLWAEAEGTRADYVELDADVRFSGGERVAVLGAGVVAEGTVVDAEGAPLAGVLVRSQQAQRGPAALTAADGRFRLVGMARDESLEFTHPLGERFSYFGDDPTWAPGIPLRIRLTPWEILRPEGPRRTVRARVTGPDGAPLPDVVVRWIHVDDGHVREGVTDDDPPDPGAEDDEDVGESVLSLPPGPYLIHPPGAFDTHAWDPLPFLLGLDGEAAVPAITIRATPQPRLAVEGTVPDDAVARLVVEGDEESLSWDDDGTLDEVHLPAEGPAVVRVELDDGVWFFPVGPVKDGVRTAAVSVPPPRLLRIPGLEAWADVALLDGPLARTLRETEDGLVTWASGDLVLRFAAERTGLVSGPAIDVPVHIPAEGTEPIDVPVPSGAARRALDAVVHAEGPGDAAWEATYEAVDADGLDVASDEITPTAAARFPFRAGTSIRIERDGWATLRATLDGPGERTMRWGDAALAFTARDEDGEPAEFSVLLDGESFVPREGEASVTIRGLSAGPVELVLVPEDEDFRAKELRLVLRPGETRTREVVFVRR